MTTITLPRAVLEQALEALGSSLYPQPRQVAAIATLRSALAQQAEPVEPVAWRTFDGEGGYDYRTYEDNEDYAAEWAQRNPRHVGWVEPLYLTPPQRKPLAQEQAEQAMLGVWQDVPGAVNFGIKE